MKELDYECVSHGNRFNFGADLLEGADINVDKTENVEVSVAIFT